MKKNRRNPLAKENFLEGNRQKWAGIFTAIGLIIMGITAYGWIKDPTPFLTYFMSIGFVFIAGASASAVMNSWKVNSTTANESLEETKNEHTTIEYVEKVARPKDADDGTLD